MIPVVCLSALLLFILAVTAMPVSAASPPETAWIKIYPGEEESFVPTADGYAITSYRYIGDYASNPQMLRDLYYIKTDRDGNEIWNRTWKSLAWFPEFVPTDKIIDGYLMVNYSAIGKASDLDGDIQWAISPARGTSMSSLVETDDGYVWAGYNMTGPFTADLSLFKIDRNGNLAWSKSYPNITIETGSEWSEALSVIATDDGYVMTGQAYNTEFASVTLLVKTDKNGDLEWYRTYGGKFNDIGKALIADKDGYIIAGHKGVTLDDYDKGNVYLAKTDLNGNLTWEKTFGGKGYFYGDHPDMIGGEAIIEVPGGYVIAGFTDLNGSSDNKLFLVRTDRDGNYIWSNTYDLPDKRRNAATYGKTYLYRVGDSYLISVSSYDINNTYWTYLLKTNPDASLATPTPAPTPTPVPATPTAKPSPFPGIEAPIAIGAGMLLYAGLKKKE